MGRKDTVTKDYMKDNEVFADAFNFLLYEGRQVIAPDRLLPMDTAEIAAPYGADGAETAQQRYRDGLRCLAAMRDENAAYLILGNENQAEVHYAMPVKNMLYDALQYASQVERAARTHRKSKDAKGKSSGEFLSGFYKEDKLIPVITLVILFHGDKWDGPLSIHDMLDLQDEEILPFVENYRIHLIEPCSIEPELLGHFHSNLREVISFFKYSKNKEKLRTMFDEDERFRRLDRKAARVIQECGDVKFEIEEEEEKVNMCKGWEDMRKEAYEEGRRAGEEKVLFEILGRLVKNGMLKPEDAAKQGNMPEGEFLEKMERYDSNDMASE